MLRISEYLNGNFIDLYKYKVTNLKQDRYLDLSLVETNSIELEYVGKISGNLENSSPILKEFPNGENSILLEYIEDFSFNSNDAPYDPLNEEETSFYLFSFKNPKIINYDKDNFYYINNGSSVIYDTENYGEDNNLFQTNFSNVKSLKNFDTNRIVFKQKNEINQTINNISIKMPKTILLSDLSFFGTKTFGDEKINNYMTKAIITNNLDDSNLDNVYFYPKVLNPIKVENENAYWFDSFNNYLRFIFNFEDKYINLETFKSALKRYINNQDINEKIENITTIFFETIERCYYVTKTIMTSFTGFTEQQKNSFKETIYNGSNVKEYTDWQLKLFFDEAEKIGNDDILMCFKTFVLMMSSILQSSYCLKGGFTEEHKLFLPFYIVSFELNTRKLVGFYLESNFYKKVDNKIVPKDFINRHNIFQFGTNTITLPFLPNQIQEVDISNSPLDFNTAQSLNFNFLLWSPSKKDNLSSTLKTLDIEKPKTTINTKIIELDFDLRGGRATYQKWAEKKYPKKLPNGQYKPDDWKPQPITINSSEWFNSKYELEDFDKLVDTQFKKEILRQVNKTLEETPTNWDLLTRDKIKVMLHNPHCFKNPRSNEIICEFRRVKFTISWDYKIKDENLKYYKPNFLYSNVSEYLDISSEIEKEIELNLTFEQNFNLEKILIKSIFADSIKLKTNRDTDFKEYKLSSASNKLNTTTKIYI